MFRRLVILSVIAAVFAPFTMVLAEQSAPENNPVCWKKQQCTETRARIGDKSVLSLTDEEKRQMGDGFVPNEGECTGGPSSDPWGKCLPANVATTEISFGGKQRFLHIGDFIKTNYRYALGIVGILAAVMMIVAGFQWITSGGNSEAITSAKKRIGGAIVGMFIAYMSYFILSVINPATVNLRLPQVWLIRTINLSTETNDWCDPTQGSQTRTNCEKMGKTCVPINWVDPSLSTPCLTAYKSVAFLAVGAAGIGSGAAGVIGGGINATLGNLVRFGGAKIVNYVMPIKNATGVVNTTVQVIKVGGGKLLIPAAFLLGDQAVFGGAVREVAGEAIVDATKATGGLALDALRTVWSGSPNGMCVNKANRSLGPGAVCGDDTNCAGGAKCVSGPFSSDAKCFASTNFGFCSNGGQHAACTSDGNNCKAGFQCVKNAKWDIYSCSDGKAGADCGGNSDCKDGMTCSNGYCAQTQFANVPDGEPCQQNTNCLSGQCMVVTNCGAEVKPLSPDETGATQAITHKYFTDMYVSVAWSGSRAGAIGICYPLREYSVAAAGNTTDEFLNKVRKRYKVFNMRYCQMYDKNFKFEAELSDNICNTGCRDVDDILRRDFAPHYGN